MSKSLLSRSLLLLTLCASIAFAPATFASTESLLKPTEAQSATTIDIIDRLSKRHYRTLAIDDALSQAFLNDYLKSLDPARLYFYASDIKKFEEDKLKHDDYLKKGNLQPGFDIHAVYRKRVSDRLKWVIAKLKEPETKFDFETKDFMEVDREDSPWVTSQAEADALWDKRLRLSLLNLKLTDKTVDEAKEILKRRYKNQLSRVAQQTNQDVYEALINAFARQYDPHTSYFSPRTSKNFNINMSLQLEGIGAVLKSEDEHTTIVRLVVGGPADQEGQLQPTDKIVGVAQGEDGELVDVVGWRLDEVVDLIRGKKDTIVKLEVISGETDAKTVHIKRGTVKLEDQAAQKAVLEVSDGERMRRIGVIDVPAFYHDFDAYRRGDKDFRSTTRDVARLLSELDEENVEGIILDLRNNGGGSLQEATMLTDLFIDPGPVVQIRDAKGRVNQSNRSRSRALYRGPLVVMVNRLSASASEIFAGAIQDYQRGIIVGSQSFGKGTVQLLSALPEGQLKLTESKFYRVSGESTQHRGIIPDIALPELVDPEQVGEAAYTNALAWDKIAPTKHGEYFNFSSILPSLSKLHEDRASNDPDIIDMIERKQLSQRLRNRTTVSLNHKERLMEKEQLERDRMALENNLRQAKGLKPFKDIDAYRSYGEEEEEEAIQKAASATSSIDVKNDALLNETGYILLDMVNLLEGGEEKLANF